MIMTIMSRITGLLLCLMAFSSFSLPSGFVYLDSIAPDIEQEMKYAGSNNFTGHQVTGYHRGRCILSYKAAQQLKKAQAEARKRGYGLKVYDCYRPVRAVDYFYRWSQNRYDRARKAWFYPRVEKEELFAKGYIARYSSHSRGSTVDLTLTQPAKAAPHQAIRQCYSRSPDYLDDNSINMGTRHDCLDPSAHYNYRNLSATQQKNRRLLREIMNRAGFRPYAKEWWHFTLRNEPWRKKYFDFPVQ